MIAWLMLCTISKSNKKYTINPFKQILITIEMLASKQTFRSKWRSKWKNFWFNSCYWLLWYFKDRGLGYCAIYHDCWGVIFHIFAFIQPQWMYGSLIRSHFRPSKAVFCSYHNCSIFIAEQLKGSRHWEIYLLFFFLHYFIRAIYVAG